MIRYRSIPKDLLTIVRVCEDEAMEDPKLLILHNAISKYLECRSVRSLCFVAAALIDID